MKGDVICPVCGCENVQSSKTYNPMGIFYACPICGRFEFTDEETSKPSLDRSKLRSFLYYNGFRQSNTYTELRYFTTLSKESCDAYKADKDYNEQYSGRPVHIDNDIVESWYPKSLSEKTDRILLHLNDLAEYVGGTIKLSPIAFVSCMFVELYKKSEPNVLLKDHDLKQQASYYVEFLEQSGYINFSNDFENLYFGITHKGYQRIDELQKYHNSGRDVLVAMKFGEDTKMLRESIRLGIEGAGYHAVFIDEVEHNGLITPELLSHIKRSRFVVVDLTHQNNGAYFEEGYAMGLGKTVIQLCKKGTSLHFDIAQKNTIIWEDETQIPLRLSNRINATIE